MEVIYSDKAQKEGAFWKKLGNKIIMNKITALIVDIQLDPFEEVRELEPLKRQL